MKRKDIEAIVANYPGLRLSLGGKWQNTITNPVGRAADDDVVVAVTGRGYRETNNWQRSLGHMSRNTPEKIEAICDELFLTDTQRDAISEAMRERADEAKRKLLDAIAQDQDHIRDEVAAYERTRRFV